MAADPYGVLRWDELDQKGARSTHVRTLEDGDGAGRADDTKVPKVSPERRGRSAGGRVLDHATDRERSTGVITQSGFPPHQLQGDEPRLDHDGTKPPEVIVKIGQPRPVACGQDQVGGAGGCPGRR